MLAEKYLRALHEMEIGNPAAMVAFTNSTLGQPWEYKGELPEEDELRDRAEEYGEWHLPAAGLIALAGVDVQHDRLAVCVWAVGKGEEMWLAYWGEYPGTTIIPHDGAWKDGQDVSRQSFTHGHVEQV